jgi:hypothetical protein
MPAAQHHATRRLPANWAHLRLGLSLSSHHLHAQGRKHSCHAVHAAHQHFMFKRTCSWAARALDSRASSWSTR